LEGTIQAKRRFRDSLCFHCVNAVPNYEGTHGCKWSKYFLPVEGWDAKSTDLSVHIGMEDGKCLYRKTPSFDVIDCPEFIEG